MPRPILTTLALVFSVPVASFAIQNYQSVLSPFAFAQALPLMDGCGDVPEAIALADELQVRSLRIERYMQEIERREHELEVAESGLQSRLSQLKSMKASIRSDVTASETRVQSDIDRLVALYGEMKPADAAEVLTNLPADFAAEILIRVAPSAGARIIAAVEPNKAAILTSYMGARSLQNR